MTDKTTSAIDLLALAEQCEAATAEQQRELLNEAWLLIHDENAICPDWTASHAVKQFAAKVRANAFTDAALTLVPKEHRGNWLAGYVIGGKAVCTINFERQREAATPALAICAAALRARASLENGQ